MAKFTVYGTKLSTATQRVIIALREKGITDFTLESVEFLNAECKAPEFLKKQPFGRVPAFTDGDIHMFESRAIALYIAKKYEGQGNNLLGGTPQEQADVATWYEVHGQEYEPFAATVIAETFLKAEKDPKALELAVKRLANTLDVYEKHLSSSKYLAGDHFSLADLGHYGWSYMFQKAGQGELLSSRPNVARWWADITARESFKQTIAEAREAFPDMAAKIYP